VSRNKAGPKKGARKDVPETLQQEFLPGSTPIPNWFFDELMPEMPESVLRVFLYLFRKTIGWNNETEEKSLHQIMADNKIASRHTAVYAVKILCDCWSFWRKTRGKKGQHSSIFAVDGIRHQQQAWARVLLTESIYGSPCPTRKQLKERPPTQEVYQRALAEQAAENGPDWWIAEVALNAKWFSN
jgi:hypothetical protein